MINRETIAAALFAKVSNAAGFTTKSRVLRHWSEMQPAEMPAMFMVIKPMTPDYVNKRPAAWRLTYDLYLYAHSESVDASPSSVMNGLLDAVELALTPGAGLVQDLGLEQVKRCFINGTVETDDGLLGNTAVAIVPIEVLASAG